MAQVSVSFGDELKDGFKIVDNWAANGIKWLDDVQSFYRERAVIEKEYASKLVGLSSKYFEKKAKLSAGLSVGDTPQVTPGSLENASLVTWTEILSQTEEIGKEKQRLASEFTMQIADQIHGLEVRFDETRKKYVSCHESMVEAREGVYNDLKKAKTAYDSACQKMEDQRLKASKSFDRGKEKANRKVEDKEIDMNNAKNFYLVKLNVANRVKDKYYQEDVPELLDGFQAVNEARVGLLNRFWKQSVSLERACLTRCVEDLDKMTGVVEQNLPVLDSAMFVKHNMQQWSPPVDFQYTPSPIWYDDEAMKTDDQGLRYLRKRLADASTKLDNETRTCESKMEVYNTTLEAKKADFSNVNSTTVTQLLNKHLSALQSLTAVDTLRLIQSVEVETIQAATSDKDMDSVPIEQGKARRGLFGRKKVETVVPNNITRITSSSSAGTASSEKASRHHSSFMSGLLGRNRSKNQPSSVTSADTSTTYAQVLYSYAAAGDDEVSVSEGQRVEVVDEDDGSGWVNVRSDSGEGLVPASYVQVIESTGGDKKKGPAVAPRRGAKKISYVIALYDYEANDTDELSITAGDKIVVVTEDSGDGWTEGEVNGKRGTFPSSYVKGA